MSAAEADEVALCYGWIDTQRKSHDETYFLQKVHAAPAGGLVVPDQRRPS